jgi:hypothetical protein
MNTNRRILCGYCPPCSCARAERAQCPHKRPLWRVIIAGVPQRLMLKLPNGVECCPSCAVRRGELRIGSRTTPRCARTRQGGLNVLRNLR